MQPARRPLKSRTVRSYDVERMPYWLSGGTFAVGWADDLAHLLPGALPCVRHAARLTPRRLLPRLACSSRSPQGPHAPGSITHAYFMSLYSQVYELVLWTRSPFTNTLGGRGASPAPLLRFETTYAGLTSFSPVCQPAGKGAALTHDRLTAWAAERADAQLQVRARSLPPLLAPLTDIAASR